MTRGQYEGRGFAFALLMFLLSVPVTAFLVWVVIVLAFGDLDVERAFAIIVYTSISVGPAFVAWRVWRTRALKGKQHGV